MKKTTLYLGLGVLVICSSWASATVYTYDSSDTNWYETGEFTRAGTVRMITDPQGTNVINAVWNTALNPTGGQFFLGDWAGATWVAPEGEKIVSITMSGWYRADGGLSCMGYGLLGGTASPEETVYLSAQGGTPAWVGYSWTETVNIDSADDVQQLELRSWWHLGGDPVAVGTGADAYYGYIGSVAITTVPEPASLCLVCTGLVGILSNRLKKGRVK